VKEGSPPAESGIGDDMVVAQGHESQFNKIDANFHKNNIRQVSEERRFLAPFNIVRENQEKLVPANMLKGSLVVGQ